MRHLAWLFLMCAACSSSVSASESAPPPSNRPRPTVEVAHVASRPIEYSLQLEGELSPYETVALYSRVSGFVEQVQVDRGSMVKRGQVLARISAPELAAQRAEAESKEAASKSTVERLQAAAATPGVVARHDIEVAEAMLKADDDRVRALRAQEAYLTVSAPFDGVITERNVHPGALVGPPSGPQTPPLLRIETLKRLRLTVAVPELEVAGVTEGATASFSVRTWPGQKFSGTIQRISHVIDPKTRTMAVELDVANDDARLASGMFAQVTWPVKRPGNSLMVPSSAVVQAPERVYVDRVKDGVIEQVPVSRGVAVADQVEVFGALAPGDVVLKRGSEELKAGDHVTVKGP